MKIIKKNTICSLFLKFSIIFFSAIILFLIFFSRSSGFVFLNSFHTKIGDTFFNLLTHLGDGIFIIMLSIGLFFLSKKHRLLAVIILVSYFSSGIFVSILKSIISSPRPYGYFKVHHIKYVASIFLNHKESYNSFPSGHTASFFALAVVIANYFKTKQVSIFIFFISVLVGYSRIYIAYHFLIDVFAGSIIGVTFGWLSQNWGIMLYNSSYLKKLFKPKPINYELNNTIYS